MDSKAQLKPYGIASDPRSIARTQHEAVTIAKNPLPVVAKAVSAALAHKSDIGAVKLNLNSAQEVRAAFEKIAKIAKRARIALDGVLIAEQISDGLELVLGVHRDPEMGPVILFGAGGVELELHPDVALGALPLDEPLPWR